MGVSIVEEIHFTLQRMDKGQWLDLALALTQESEQRVVSCSQKTRSLLVLFRSMFGDSYATRVLELLKKAGPGLYDMNSWSFSVELQFADSLNELLVEFLALIAVCDNPLEFTPEDLAWSVNSYGYQNLPSIADLLRLYSSLDGSSKIHLLRQVVKTLQVGQVDPLFQIANEHGLSFDFLTLCRGELGQFPLGLIDPCDTEGYEETPETSSQEQEEDSFFSLRKMRDLWSSL